LQYLILCIKLSSCHSHFRSKFSTFFHEFSTFNFFLWIFSVQLFLIFRVQLFCESCAFNFFAWISCNTAQWRISCTPLNMQSQSRCNPQQQQDYLKQSKWQRTSLQYHYCLPVVVSVSISHIDGISDQLCVSRYTPCNKDQQWLSMLLSPRH
jgi:hypothetical protein